MSFQKKVHVYFKVLSNLPNLLVLTGIYFYALFVGLSYNNSWMHTEAASLFQPASLERGGNKLLYWDSYKNIFDSQKYEGGQPRPTRPLSNILTVINAKLRSKLWRYIPPHPSLSLMTLVAAVFVPLLLFLLLGEYGLETNWAIGGVCLYLASPASLSEFTHLFRPGKGMTNFSFVLFLFWASKLEKKIANESLDQSKSTLSFVLFTLALYFSFFWDETALLLFPMIWLFHPRLIHHKIRGPIFFTLPFLATLSYLKFIPWLSDLAGHGSPDLLTYDHVGRLTTGHDQWPFYFLVNLWLLFSDSLGLHSPLLPPSYLGKLLLTLSSLAAAAFVVSFFKYFLKYLNGLKKIFLWTLFLAFSHTVLMQSNSWQAHGIFYYGNHFSLFFSLLIILFLRKKWAGQGNLRLFVFLVLLLPGTIYKFHYYNLFRKFMHTELRSPELVLEYMLDKKNRYTINYPLLEAPYTLTKKKWQNIRSTGLGFEGEEYYDYYFNSELIALLYPHRPEILEKLFVWSGEYDKVNFMIDPKYQVKNP